MVSIKYLIIIFTISETGTDSTVVRKCTELNIHFRHDMHDSSELYSLMNKELVRLGITSRVLDDHETARALQSMDINQVDHILSSKAFPLLYSYYL